MELFFIRDLNHLHKIKNKNIDKYLFIGKNSLLHHNINSAIEGIMTEVNYKMLFSTTQYKYREKYFDFIDEFEKKSGKKRWWASSLSGKNPWISNFYLRFCQVKVLDDIIKSELNNGTEGLVFFIEEKIIFETLKEYVNSKYNYKSYFYDKTDFDNIKLLFKGYLRRAVSLAKYSYDYVRNSIAFFKNNLKNINLDKSIVVLTFIDSRCFKNNKYYDPFIGKFLDKIENKHHVIIAPVFIKSNLIHSRIFSSWLSKKKYSLMLPQNQLSKLNHIILIFKSFFTYPKSVSEIFFCDVNVKYLINKERLEEWSNFSLNNDFIISFTRALSKIKGKKLIIYPFENQIWERLMLDNLKNDSSVISFGVQNAPAPKLSTRYYFSKKIMNELPLPTYMFVTGEISFNNLFKYYSDYCNVIKLSSSRSIVSLKKNSGIKKRNKNIFVACSISVGESIELIAFVIKSLKDLEDININILPHPLANYNYRKLLKVLKAPLNVKLKDNFISELNQSDLVVFDSSTVGLEALLNGIIPVHITHVSSLDVNPNEYDLVFTKVAYDTNDLLKAVRNHKADISKTRDVALSFYNSKDMSQNSKLVNDIWLNFTRL
jgi:hypothetical protein